MHRRRAHTQQTHDVLAVCRLIHTECSTLFTNDLFAVLAVERIDVLDAGEWVDGDIEKAVKDRLREIIPNGVSQLECRTRVVTDVFAVNMGFRLRCWMMVRNTHNMLSYALYRGLCSASSRAP